jgi:hypothetical protein
MSTSCVSNAVFLSSKQNETQVCCFFKRGIGKPQITLHVHNYSHLLQRNAEVYGNKTRCATHNMAIPYHLVAEAILLAIHTLHGESGNFYTCLHMDWIVEVQFTVPTTLTICSSLTRRKSLQGLANSASVHRMLTVGWPRGMPWLGVTSNNLSTTINLVHVHLLHSQQGFFPGQWTVDCSCVTSHKCLGQAVVAGTWVVVVIELGQSVIQSIYQS